MSITIPARLVILGFFVLSSQANSATFTPIGDLPGASTLSNAYAVSADGRVVVGFGTASVSEFGTKYEAFRWTAGEGMTGLGPPIEVELTVPTSVARAVSGDGSLAVGYATRQGAVIAATWDSAGQLSFLGNVFARPTIHSDAHDTSHDGTLVVGAVSFIAGVEEAFVWSNNSGMQLLTESMPNIASSRALAVSPDGGVVFGTVSEGAGQEAFRWTTDNGLVRLGELPGGGFGSIPRSASYDGAVVVGDSRSANSLGGLEAFVWTAETGMVALGDLPGGAFGSSASDVSADGRVIVGSSATELGGTAFIWDELHGMRSLQAMLELEYGLSDELTGWRLSGANAISADGFTIAGVGINPDGASEAWVVRIDSAPVPEPATKMLAALGILFFWIIHTVRQRRCTETTSA